MEVAEKPKISVRDLPDDKLVGLYIKIRDARTARKAAYDNADADDKSKQEKIERILLERFNERGADSTKTSFGTAYKSVKTSATVADRQVFMDYVRDNSMWELLDVRANKGTVTEFRVNNNDVPPGINWSETVVVGVRRS